MLKQLFSLILITSFLSSVLGVQVYKHYCGDFLADVSLYIQSNPCADERGVDKCTKGEMKSCCDDEFQYIQLDINLQKTDIKRPSFNHIAFIQILTYIIETKLINLSNQFEPKLIEPPEKKVTPLYKLLHRYTFYG